MAVRPKASPIRSFSELKFTTANGGRVASPQELQDAMYNLAGYIVQVFIKIYMDMVDRCSTAIWLISLIRHFLKPRLYSSSHIALNLALNDSYALYSS